MIDSYNPGTDLKRKQKDKDAIKHIINKDAMLLDYWAQEDGAYTLIKKWSNLPKDWILQMGYLTGEKFQTDLKYINTKTYVRFHNWKLVDPAEKNNFMTSATLYDYLKSNSCENFISGMTKISFAPIDLKMVMVAAPIIIGIIIGMVYFMG